MGFSSPTLQRCPPEIIRRTTQMKYATRNNEMAVRVTREWVFLGDDPGAWVRPDESFSHVLLENGSFFRESVDSKDRSVYCTHCSCALVLGVRTASAVPLWASTPESAMVST